MSAVDLGCGEGANAQYLSERGTRVLAIDLSEIALDRARQRPKTEQVTWKCADAMDIEVPVQSIDLVVGYGLLHCLRDRAECAELIRRAYDWLMPGGYVIAVCFNGRKHERFSDAHPGFAPLLLSHEEVRSLFHRFAVIYAEDADLVEIHPDLDVQHSHSLSKIIARKQ